jgi:hypothetical protein
MQRAQTVVLAALHRAGVDPERQLRIGVPELPVGGQATRPRTFKRSACGCASA